MKDFWELMDVFLFQVSIEEEVEDTDINKATTNVTQEGVLAFGTGFLDQPLLPN